MWFKSLFISKIGFPHSIPHIERRSQQGLGNTTSSVSRAHLHSRLLLCLLSSKNLVSSSLRVKEPVREDFSLHDSTVFTEAHSFAQGKRR